MKLKTLQAEKRKAKSAEALKPAPLPSTPFVLVDGTSKGQIEERRKLLQEELAKLNEVSNFLSNMRAESFNELEYHLYCIMSKTSSKYESARELATFIKGTPKAVVS